MKKQKPSETENQPPKTNQNLPESTPSSFIQPDVSDLKPTLLSDIEVLAPQKKGSEKEKG